MWRSGIVSLFDHGVYIPNGGLGVVLVEHEEPLDLGHAHRTRNLGSHGRHEVSAAGLGLGRVKLAEDGFQLIIRRVTDILADVHTARTNQRRVQPAIGRNAKNLSVTCSTFTDTDVDNVIEENIKKKSARSVCLLEVPHFVVVYLLLTDRYGMLQQCQES